jgi:hypothetical protein
MFNMSDIDEKISVANGDSNMANTNGSLKRCVVQLDGSVLDITIKKVKYVPKLCATLFSINKAISNGFSHSNKGTSIFLARGSASIIFDRVITLRAESFWALK